MHNLERILGMSQDKKHGQEFRHLQINAVKLVQINNLC